MKLLKYIIISTLSVCVLLSCCACNSNNNNDNINFYEQLKFEDSDIISGVVTENDKYLLSWDADNACIKLTEKKTNKIWSSTPMTADGNYVEDINNIYSPINIEYIRKSAYRTIELTGKVGAVNNGRIYAENITDGIKLTFMFDELSIAIPVNFTLNDNGLSVNVKTSDIVENPNNDDRIYKISLLPYFCCVENSEENYLFVPSGSGALMYTDERDSGISRQFNGKIYGQDPVQEVNERYTNTSDIRMGVFSATENNSTITAIVTNSAEKCDIKAVAGDAQLGFSNIYPSFQLRGYNGTVLDYGGSTGKKLINYYTDDMISDSVLEIQYSTTTSEKSGYVVSAETYRDYISNKYSIQKKTTDNILSLKFFGAVQTKNHFLGFPYSSDIALTSFKDVVEIIKDISVNPDVQLIGFGEGGIDGGKLAGGFSFSGALNNKKDLKSLLSFSRNNSIPLYFDYDLLYFNKSGNGFSTSKDNCHTANGYPAEIFSYSPSTNDKIKELGSKSILSRLRIDDAIDKLIGAIEKNNIESVSLSTFSNTSFSDFAEDKYQNCSDIDAQVNDCISKLSQKGFNVAVSDANDYAAVLSDKIFDAPTSSGNFESLDVDIPFYEMVFKGFIPLSTDSINIAVDENKQLLKCIEIGAPLQYSLIKNYNSQLAFYNHDNLQLMVYANNVDNIKENLEKSENYLRSVKDLCVSDYIIINNELRKTVFEDGTVVYVNYSSSDCNFDNILIPAMDYKVVH